jgi:hypothetical protein
LALIVLLSLAEEVGSQALLPRLIPNMRYRTFERSQRDEEDKGTR